MLPALQIEMVLHVKLDKQHVVLILLLLVVQKLQQEVNALEQVMCLELALQLQQQQHVLQYLLELDCIVKHYVL